MANMLQKARSGRANALKTLTDQNVAGETFVVSNGRRHVRPSKTAQALMFTSVRSQNAPKTVTPVTAARIKAEKAFLAASGPAAVHSAFVH